MYSQEVLVKNLVMKIKQELFSPDVDLVSLVPPSPYDTAWLSMIPNPHRGSDEPLFKGCLDWVLQHQSIRGFWGDDDHVPTLGSLTSTLACIVALTTWDVGYDAIQKGLAFIHASTEKLLEEQNGTFPEWFVIVFPAMVELAQTKGLRVYFSHGSTALVEQVFQERKQIFQMHRLVQSGDQQQYYSLEFMQYLEALPETYDINSNETLLISQSEEDGLFIQSPSAIAYAFMKTGRKEFLSKLDSIVQRCGFSVPAIYPMDEDLLRVCLINRIERLGLEEHFMAEIKSMLGQVYRSYISCEEPKSKEVLQLYKDSLAFRLLRLHGYTVSPRKFCWFLDDEDKMFYIEEHHEIFLRAIYNVYRATDVTFTGESQLEDVKEFCRRILEKQTLKDSKNLIKHEISIPWLARLDHLEHRKFIEREEPVGPWTGRGLSYGLSCQSKGKLLQLAIENYTLRQSMFRNELKELEMWSKGMGLVEMGFARQKTAYCYFAVASTVSHSSLSCVRLAVAKGAVIVTVADDFFDKEGPMNELEALANAVKRWQNEGLDGHGKTIFKALKDFVDDISWQFFNQNGYDIKSYLQDLWQQTFVSWLKEAEWSRNGHPSSIVEYLQVATCSIASHTILLSAALLLSTPPELEILKSPQSHPLTNSLMVLTRLLNEIQSYQKEQEEGKPNLVLLHMKGNPNLGAEESIGIIQKMLEEKKKEFLEHALVINGINGDGMPEACKKLHLFCLKVFQMFFNSTNVFDSPTELLADINKAIYDPLRVDAQGISKKDKKILASYGKSQTTCVMKVQGNLRKEFVAKPYLGYGVLSLKLRKPTIFTTFRNLKVCNYSGYWV
ncbi:S-linalool synthase [Pyrus ussuriensis x Pyrus communis]|uniref:S-linalool synthase n=1 Tax=Pyrus ussuriensis x Pyrus communis TaxID=2448454 RepID=A0A5N5FRK3_9ROSA|nr:S-linalool synthase [Pyrus ussuriensis x Pyrus communis]